MRKVKAWKIGDPKSTSARIVPNADTESVRQARENGETVTRIMVYVPTS